ncbi:MAG: APC family permease [Simkaniaceae bacterium]
MKKKISLFSLVLLITAAIDSIRNLPAAALFGPSVIFFFTLAALLFLIPTALVAAELSATFPEKGGVYHWVQMAFGDHVGMLAIWLQWINTIVWYPTILSFIAGTIAYVISPDLAQNQYYIASVIFVVFWGLTLLNLKGLHLSAKVNAFCMSVGTIFPMILLITLGFYWFFAKKTLQITFSSQTIFPTINNSQSFISLVAIMASFLGMELSGVHVKDVDNPQKTFPKAIFISSAFILLTMLFGSLSIAIVLPDSEINLVAGVMQVFQSFFAFSHIEFFTPILAFLIVIGSVGSIINWLISPAKGLLHASEFGFMPASFSKKNAHGVPSKILLTQAIFVSALCLIFLFIPSVNSFYWFLTALSTSLYMLMYILMFFSALYHHKNYLDRPKAFKIPGNHLGMCLTCLLGLLGATLTIIVSFFAPEEISVRSLSTYSFMIAGGLFFMILPVSFFYLYRYFNRRQHSN